MQNKDIFEILITVLKKIRKYLFAEDAKPLDALGLTELGEALTESIKDVFCARILTPNELAKLEDGDVVWEQLATPLDPEDQVFPLVKYKGYVSNHKFYIVWPQELEALDYGTTWRVWSSKPTNEQLATPWAADGSFEPFADEL